MKFVIGCDYGTLSMRAILVRLADGAVLAQQVYAYPCGVITEKLPGSGVELPGPDWALQNPDDYLAALHTAVPALLAETGVAGQDVVAIGLDFTTCTVVPVAADGRALCQHEAYRNRPHAWVKLWKNHTAHREADDITEFVARTGHNLLDYYGHRAGSEWFFPKVWEVLRKDPEIYNAAYTFLEAGDFIVYKLSGNMVRSGVFAAARAFYDNAAGQYPDEAFFAGLDPKLTNIVRDKHLGNVATVGTPAGTLTPAMAQSLGLTEQTVVCVSHADAACTLPGAGIAEPYIMTYVMGTSTCHMMMAEELVEIPGINAAYYEGILPGYYCYEAGQSAVGDIFDWFCRGYVPESYTAEANARGMHIMQLLNEKARHLRVGESGLVALDWMNGNRSILQDTNLTGLIMGLTLSTKPEEVYHALLEATAFGTRAIMDQFGAYGVRIDKLYACGGLAQKNPLLMQIYSDVMGKSITVSAVKETSAMASAIFAAVAAGPERGGHAGYREAVAAMVPAPSTVYKPVLENTARYAALYNVYKELHDTLSKSASPMKALREMQLAYV